MGTGRFSVSAAGGTPRPVLATGASTKADFFGAPAGRQRLDDWPRPAPEMGLAALQRQIAAETPL